VRSRIAIPMPHSTDLEYGERAMPQYERAVVLAGGDPIRIPLKEGTTTIRKLSESCDAVLLPGSNADINPEKFRQIRSTHTAADDKSREEADFLLLDDAYARRKPVLCICYGLQSLNVYRGGSLVQHIPDFLPETTRAKVNHEAGRKIAVAHDVEVDADSRIREMITSAGRGQRSEVDGRIIVPVNSSHHQSSDAVGDGLRIVARCPDDGIVEALEGTSLDHFVVAVQWHPERSVDDDEASRAIFRAFIAAANHR
jgi:putative glutamine amidotransferase